MPDLAEIAARSFLWACGAFIVVLMGVILSPRKPEV